MPGSNVSTPSSTASYDDMHDHNEAMKIEVTQPDGSTLKRPYYGKCQYKTGKCFNERTLKRNGDAHSLCEEHRVKQNLIQRRSDRKYQTVHAIRRRERSQRRAVLKKQVSMAVAQQLFYEHQQQKSMGLQIGLPVPSSHSHGSSAHSHSSHSSHGSHSSHSHSHSSHAPSHSSHSLGSVLASHSSSLPHPPSGPLPHVHQHTLTHAHPLHGNGPAIPAVQPPLAPPIQIPGKIDLTHFTSPFASSTEGLASPILSFNTPSAFSSSAASDRHSASESNHSNSHDHGQDKDKDRDHVVKDEKNTSPTGIDDFTPDSFLPICVSDEADQYSNNFAPIMSTIGEKEMWTEDDIEFLQNLLLA
ncbi:TPA: hypothetical protein N0F65_009032 [Lagenidium giganteum]|uniref:Uncharacterized protein n=1 Tax=Lagenidium giganteum TaxID=4803 RepID=A0AAV2YX39_9STRA|nr:TPA: hypothetical protein N0F65_009032 [Lagenidium giganteum]